MVDYFQICEKVLLVNQYWNYYKISSNSAVRQYRNNLKELQIAEFKLLSEKVHIKSVDMDTIQLNQYIQFDYQYIHHLYQKEENLKKIYKKMKEYIQNRKYKWKHFSNYNINKINKKSIPVAWAMAHGFVRMEALLCMLREQKCRAKAAGI